MDRTITVFIWRYENKDNVGHAALELSDKTYISWWPKGKGGTNFKATKKIGVEAYPGRTFQIDKSAEGRAPDEVVEIPVSQAQEKAVEIWWTGVLNNPTEKYHLLKNNCSTIAYRALREAGCCKAKPEPFLQIWTPNMALKYARKCEKIRKPHIDDGIEIGEEATESEIGDSVDEHIIEIGVEATEEYLQALTERIESMYL